MNKPKINEEYINWVIELKKLISSSQRNIGDVLGDR